MDEHAVPRYHDADDPDPVGHDDLGELVPALTPGAAGWRGWREERGGYLVERYLPRTAQQPVHIERWTATVTGECHWIVTTADSQRHIYGRDARARIADPDDPRRVATWLLEESSDNRGNIVAYRYERENSDEVMAGSPEARTLRPADAQIYLKAVQYGNRTPGVPDAFAFLHTFDYGDHNDDIPAPEPDRPWPLRPDPHSRRRGWLRSTHPPPVSADPVVPSGGAGSRGATAEPGAGGSNFTYDLRENGSLLAAVTRHGRPRRSEHHFSASQRHHDLHGPNCARPNLASARTSLESPTWGIATLDRSDGTGLPGLLSYGGGAPRYAANLGGGRSRLLVCCPRCLRSTPRPRPSVSLRRRRYLRHRRDRHPRLHSARHRRLLGVAHTV